MLFFRGSVPTDRRRVISFYFYNGQDIVNADALRHSSEWTTEAATYNL